jgi:hypothetical protein
MSATNYSQADAASTIGGGAAPLTAPEKPGQFDTPSSPSSLGGGVMPPFLWSVLENFIPDTWPDGNPGRLRASAAAWQSFASTINGIAGELSGPSGVVGSQQIPEGGAMTSAMSELSQSQSGVATEAGNLATQTRDFADDVQSTPTACTPTRPDCGATPTPTTTPESLRPTTAAPTPRTRHDRCTR